MQYFYPNFGIYDLSKQKHNDMTLSNIFLKKLLRQCYTKIRPGTCVESIETPLISIYLN